MDIFMTANCLVAPSYTFALTYLSMYKKKIIKRFLNTSNSFLSSILYKISYAMPRLHFDAILLTERTTRRELVQQERLVDRYNQKVDCFTIPTTSL